MVYQELAVKPVNVVHGRGRLGLPGDGGADRTDRRAELPAPLRREYAAVGGPQPGPAGQLHFGEALCAETIAGLFRRSAVSRPFTLPKRQAVYGSLDDDRSIYLIERGQVKAVATSPGGKECLIGIYAVGEVFGELSIICPQRIEMVTTMTPVVLRRMNAATALDALSDADSRDEFIRRLAHRLFEQQRLIVDLVTTDSEHRLAAILLYLGHKLGRREGSLLRIESRITQEELSGMVGTTRSRVGYFLKRFAQAQMVARSGSSSLILHEPRIREFIACG
jgi:CRP/FNR family cyclic AMP-dependent transcriptional regulator